MSRAQETSLINIPTMQCNETARAPPLVADPIDIVKDYIPPHEYLVEEDPKLYQSVKTRRGPLSDDWIEEINQNPAQAAVMCAYKLCKVEFRYWGMQSKIERFIHDVGGYGRRCVGGLLCKLFILP